MNVKVFYMSYMTYYKRSFLYYEIRIETGELISCMINDKNI